MSLEVVVDGTPLRCYGKVSTATDSTRYTTDDWSGDYQASCRFAPVGSFDISWFRAGMLYEHRENGVRTWGGLLTEPAPGDDGSVLLSAFGLGVKGANYQAFEARSSPPAGTAGVKSSTDPNAAVDYAVANLGLPWVRDGLLTGSVVADPKANSFTISELLTAALKTDGKRWWVDSHGYVSAVTDPTDSTWVTTPNAGYLGTTDENYYSDLYGLYVYAIEPTTGAPIQWEWVHSGDVEAAAQFGYKAAKVDLTALGLIATSLASSNVAGRMALLGARMGFTNGLTLTSTNLYRSGFGPASPLSLWGRDGAGSMLTIPGAADRSRTTTRHQVQIVLGQVTRNHDDATAAVLPVGFVPRDFSSALAAAQPPSDLQEVL